MTSTYLDNLKLNLIAWITQVDDVEIINDLVKIKKQAEADSSIVDENNNLNGNEEGQQTIYYTPKSYYSPEDIQAIADQFPKDKKWTYTDFWNIFPHDLKVKVEILNNTLFVMASPSLIHQKISNRLSSRMTFFVEDNNLGEILCAPMDIKFDEDNVTQPDILFIALSRYEIMTPNVIDGAPNLLVEIISPGNTKKEQADKRTLYEKKGVTEYWTIQPKNRHIKVEVLENGKYKTFSEGEKEGLIKSFVLEGFSVNIAEVIPDSLFK